MNFKLLVYIFSIMTVFTAPAMDRKPLLTEKQLSALSNPNYYFCDLKTYKNATCLICKSHEIISDAPQTNDITWITTPCCTQAHHFECLIPWLKQHPSCPLCSKSFSLPEKLKYTLDRNEQLYFMEKEFFPLDERAKSEIFWRNINNKTDSMKNSITNELKDIKTIIALAYGICAALYLEYSYHKATNTLTPSQFEIRSKISGVIGIWGVTLALSMSRLCGFNNAFKFLCFAYSPIMLHNLFRCDAYQGTLDIAKKLPSYFKNPNKFNTDLRLILNLNKEYSNLLSRPQA